MKLYEVIDDPNNDKLYLVMEYVKRGAVMSRNYWRQSTKSKGIGNEEGEGNKNRTLSEEKAKKYFRHLVLSLDYSIFFFLEVKETNKNNSAQLCRNCTSWYQTWESSD